MHLPKEMKSCSDVMANQRPKAEGSSASGTDSDSPAHRSRVSAARDQDGSLMQTLVSSMLPNVLVLAAAYVAIAMELTTSPNYVQSKALQSALKQSFIAYVCLSVHKQFGPLVLPPGRARTLRNVLVAHAKALGIAILANSAGTTIIRPAFGAAPQYEETIRLVIPIYVAVEVVIDLLRVPLWLVSFVIGGSVSWLKAVTIAKLVLQWHGDPSAHPVAFILASTANLFASGLVLRSVMHYYRTNRLVGGGLSMQLVWSLVQMLLLSALMGLVAHIANHFSTQEERQLEAALLYFLVAWFAIDKYWKAPIAYMLSLPFQPSGSGKIKRA